MPSMYRLSRADDHQFVFMHSTVNFMVFLYFLAYLYLSLHNWDKTLKYQHSPANEFPVKLSMKFFSQ